MRSLRTVLGVWTLVAVGCAQGGAPSNRPPAYVPAVAGLVVEGLSDAGDPVFRRVADGMPVVFVAAGLYDSTTETGEPGPRFYLPNYHLDAHPVTNRQYLAFLAVAGEGSWVEAGGDLRRDGDRWTADESRLDEPALASTLDGAEAYARWVGARLAARHHVDKAASFGARYPIGVVPDPPGALRCVVEQPIAMRYPVDWRRNVWDAVDEARRRNSIVFITLHWDGCGACDRFRESILTDPQVCRYLNDHVVPIIGHANQNFCEPHYSLPDGRCWIYPPLDCGDHVDCFYRGPASLLEFPGSPGHYVLDPRMGNAPVKASIVLRDDADLPGEGTPAFWLETWREAQEKLGPALGRREYERQKAVFDLNEASFAADPASLDKGRIAALAADPQAAFREEAAWITRELASGKPMPDDAAVAELREAASRVQESLTADDWREGMDGLRAMRDAPVVNPLAIWVERTTRWAEREGFQRLAMARAYAKYYGDPARARSICEALVRDLPDTDTAKAALAELETLR